MNEVTDIKTKNDAKKAIPTRNYLDIFNPGYILAGMATLATAVMSISRSLDKSLERVPVIKELQIARDEKISKAHIDPDADLVHEMHEAYKEYNEKVTAFRHGNGGKGRLRTSDIFGKETKNVLDEWKALESHNKMQVALTFLAVAFVGMGAVYSFTRQNRLTDKLHARIIEHNDKQQEVQR